MLEHGDRALSVLRERLMFLNKAKVIPSLVGGVLYLASISSPRMLAQQTKKSFTVADEIGLALFEDPTGRPAEILFSADGAYLAVKTERGQLDVNRVEDSIRFYRTQDVKFFLDHSETSEPLPVWTIAFTGKEGGIIGGWRWLADSSGIAFLKPSENGNRHLVLADLQNKTVETLTSETETLRAFDIRDRTHYVYAIADPSEQEKKKAEREAPSVVGTGRSLFELILPNDSTRAHIGRSSVSLWAVIGSKRFEVKTGDTPLANAGSLALSPDGESVVTTLPVLDVPSTWEMLYPPPPYTTSKNRVRVGHYDATSTHVHQFVRVYLRTGSIESLTDAPLADDSGWTAIGDPSWSSDGHEILLPNTFLKSKEHSPSRPCVAVVEASSREGTCVEVLKAHNAETSVEEGYHLVFGARFGGNTRHVMVAFISHEDSVFRTTEYQRAKETWQAIRQMKGAFPAEQGGVNVEAQEGLNDPPMLVAANKQTLRVIYDPNPQLKDIDLGEATVYTWKDKAGRKWKGGLYKPSDYRAGQRYPLVVQTHGFSESEFRPSGVFPTAFAARALAAAGIVVLQTATGVAGANCPVATPEEGPCAVAMLESAIQQLVSEGLVDPDKVGVIGFSRTCFHVMEMLTTSSFHVRAASITDGVMENYLQYMLFPERFPTEANPTIGAPPFGQGLQEWLKRSPGFNLDKVGAPLLIVSREGPAGLLMMWEPYAGLYYLKKPVDLIMLNTDEHILTNPAIRMASQGGSVDWFRFWLQDYEDPISSKTEQYVRWRELRKMK
jgi:dipeptidyl aminopeptidase/acylaminoacyl peptidase